MKLILQDLFEVTRQHNIVDPSYARSCKYIKDINIPEFNCPKENSLDFEKDLEEVKRCYSNPSLSEEFLKQSNNSVKKVFKNYCKKNNISVNWNHIKNLLKDVDTIVSKLKHKYDRPRPKFVLDDTDFDVSEVYNMKSPSFPSGHTTSAFFIASLIGHYFPDYSMRLSILADMIGQSRIENCVHYPTDVLAGKLLGEYLASACFENVKPEENFTVKNLVKKLKKTANKIFEEKSSKEAVKDYSHLLTDFICNLHQAENINLNYDKTYESIISLFEGYPIEYCTDEIYLQDFLKCFAKIAAYENINTTNKLLSLHNEFRKDSLRGSMPGEIRIQKSVDPIGNTHIAPEKIVNALSNILSKKNLEPYKKYKSCEFISPFSDGNTRIFGLILANDLELDIEKANSALSN